MKDSSEKATAIPPSEIPKSGIPIRNTTEEGKVTLQPWLGPIPIPQVPDNSES